MEYRAIKAGKSLEATLRARGFDPDNYTMTVKERDQYADIVNTGLRNFCEAEMWPQFIEVERRTYRPPYDATVSYSTGHEVYYGEGYWRSLVDANLGNTPVAGANWEAAEDLICFLPFVQTWGGAVNEIDPCGVQLNDCVYEEDPLLNPRAMPIQGCRFWQRSILVPSDKAPTYPYVRYRPLAPQISFTEYAAGTAYATGELCYVTADLESYVALRPSTGATPSSSAEDWAPVRVPEMCANYIRLWAKSELAADDEGKNKTLAHAEQELERLRERYISGTGDSGVARFRWRRGI